MEETNKILLIHKNLSGAGTPEEKLLLEDILNSEESDRKLYDELHMIWDKSTQITKEPVRIDKSELKADIFKIIGQAPIKSEKKIAGKFRRFTLNRAVAAAAIIAVVLSVTAVFYNSIAEITIQSSDEMVYSEIPDGSKIWIASNSSVKYSKNFSLDQRNIVLDGSAYFNVNHDAQHPFTIKVLDNTVKVVGTAFQIIKHGDRQVEVNVFSGVVEFYAKNGEYVTLGKGESAVFDYGDKKFAINSAVVGDQDLRAEYLKFQNADLTFVFDRLSKYFDKQIDLKCDKLDSMTGYTSPGFAGDDIEYYLNTIKKLYNIDIIKLSETRFEVVCPD